MTSNLTIGVPKEIKTDEYRVAMIPVGVEELTRAGHKVLIQAGAGQGSGIADEQYAAHGAEIVADGRGRLEAGRPDRQGQGAAARRMAADAAGPDRLHLLPLRRRPGPDRRGHEVGHHRHRLRDDQDAKGTLPLLTPMSEVAGRMSIQEGAKYLERPFEGRGILLGGVPGVLPANVVDPRRRRRRRQRGQGRGRPGRQRRSSSTSTSTACATSTTSCRRTSPRSSATATTSSTASTRADLRHRRRADPRREGAAPGAPRRPRSGCRTRAVIIDVAIDQGGCVETARPTTHSQADVHRRRRRPLLRDEHARRRGPHQHLCADAT